MTKPDDILALLTRACTAPADERLQVACEARDALRELLGLVAQAYSSAERMAFCLGQVQGEPIAPASREKFTQIWKPLREGGYEEARFSAWLTSDFLVEAGVLSKRIDDIHLKRDGT